MKRVQKDYLFDCFCADAKYIPQLDKPVEEALPSVDNSKFRILKNKVTNLRKNL